MGGDVVRSIVYFALVLVYNKKRRCEKIRAFPQRLTDSLKKLALANG